MVEKFQPNSQKIQECKDYPKDDIEILQVKIINKQLVITVAYSGGFESHDFGLCLLNKNNNELELFLSHNSNEDEAEAWIQKDLLFDIESLSNNTTIKIHNHTIRYR